MDIHRCRFVPYPPSTINVLAFSLSQSSKERKNADLRLAIGRANGDIEIWNPLNGAWLQESILRGGKDRSVDGLIWIQDPEEEDGTGKTIPGRLRLFSVGYTTTVTEWDLEKGQPLRQSSGNHGEIWCLAAQPQILPERRRTGLVTTSLPWQGQNLVAGCIDGAVVLYSTADGDLHLNRVLARPSAKKAKVISITFQNRNTVVAGCTDSVIRIYDIQNGAIIRSMSLGAGPAGGPKEIIIWALKCLPNGKIISGDSTGELRIWDGKTYTLIQRIKSHKQDILSLTTSNDGSTILSGGMDRRTVIYKETGVAKSRWSAVTHRRFHSHDVKTMATFEGCGMSIVASGGPDASPIVMPLREFGRENHRVLPCLPQYPIVQSAPKKRLLLSWWDREVHVWRIKNNSRPLNQNNESDSDSEDQSQHRKLMAKIIIKGEANISSASVTADGYLLAISTAAEIKLFRLKSRLSQEPDSLKVTKLDIPMGLSMGGARLIQFSPDGHWLGVVRRNSNIVAARVTSVESGVVQVHPRLLKLNRIERNTERRVLLSGLGAYDRTVTRIAFSSDGRILAAVDLSGYIDTWVLHGSEKLGEDVDKNNLSNDASPSPPSDMSDSDEDEENHPVTVLDQHWIRNPSTSLIPRIPSAVVVLSFRPTTASMNTAHTNETTTPHASHSNRHLIEASFPQGEDRLLVVTAIGRVMEFNVLQGTFSAWSRRNPPSSFPKDFKSLQDHAMGCMWDLSNSKERFWLYGSTWMWMFDLSRNLPSSPVVHDSVTNGHVNGIHTNFETARPSKKRKLDRGVKSVRNDLKSITSGAGGKIPESRRDTGSLRSHEKFLYETEDDVQQITIDHQVPSGMYIDDSDESMDGYGMNMEIKRFRYGEDAVVPNGKGQRVERDYDESPPPWWHTYKYRPIMGVVPIEGPAGLEVALVERPTWEMDLPPRYYGDQEWDQPGI